MVQNDSRDLGVVLHDGAHKWSASLSVRAVHRCSLLNQRRCNLGVARDAAVVEWCSLFVVQRGNAGTGLAQQLDRSLVDSALSRWR